MSKTVKNFDFCDELSQSFSIHILLPKSLYCYRGAQPLSFEHVSIPTRANRVNRGVKFELVEVDDIPESTGKQ